MVFLETHFRNGRLCMSPEEVTVWCLFQHFGSEDPALASLASGLPLLTVERAASNIRRKNMVYVTDIPRRTSRSRDTLVSAAGRRPEEVAAFREQLLKRQNLSLSAKIRKQIHRIPNDETSSALLSQWCKNFKEAYGEEYPYSRKKALAMLIRVVNWSGRDFPLLRQLIDRVIFEWETLRLKLRVQETRPTLGLFCTATFFERIRLIHVAPERTRKRRASEKTDGDGEW